MKRGQQMFCVVPAKDFEEAMRRSPYQMGQKAVVRDVSAADNGDGTFNIWPHFEFPGADSMDFSHTIGGKPREEE